VGASDIGANSTIARLRGAAAMDRVKDWDPARHYQDAAVAEAYDRERFSSLPGRIYNWLDKRAVQLALADLPVGSTLADIPCGTGRLAEVALDLGHSVIGIDVSAAMLAFASRRLQRFGDRFTVHVSDARSLSQEMEFDVVLCARFLVHFTFDQQGDFIKSIARHARRRMIVTHGLDSPYQRGRRAAKRLTGFFQNPAAFPIDNATLNRLLGAAGFREIRRYRPLPMVSESIIVVAERPPMTGPSPIAS
jgi:SAM-dependent methyltransferase